MNEDSQDEVAVPSRKPGVSTAAQEMAVESVNDVVGGFKEGFNALFIDSVLPKGRGKFSRIEAPHYITLRRPQESQSTGNEIPKNLYFEDLLHKTFWDETHEALVFIEGIVGCGKSTLLQYYLRCHCPSDPQRKQDFDRKFIANVDFRSTRTCEEFDQKFYAVLRRELQSKFRALGSPTQDIEGEDLHAFWNDVFDWEAIHHIRARGDLPLEEYVAKCVRSRQERLNSFDWDKEWVNLALKRIRLKLDSGSAVPFSFFVLCLDNLDQSPLEVLEHAIKIIRDWLSLGVKLWQVYIPLWPTSLENIFENIDPLPPNHRITLAPLDTDVVVRTRTSHAQKAIRSATARVIKLPAEGAEGVISLSNEEAAHFLTTPSQFEHHSFSRFLSRLAGGSARRVLTFWSWIVSSRGMQRTYLHKFRRGRAHPEGDAFAHVGTYVLIDALLTGKYPYHHRDHSPILNVFFTIDNPADERHMLLGWHILILLTRGISSKEDIQRRLVPCGYDQFDITSALREFHKKRFLQWRSADLQNEFYVDHDVVAAHYSLICEEILAVAYADNIAMVTPLPLERGKQIQLTNAYEPLRFRSRVKSTLTFLEQLLADEKNFCLPPSIKGIDPDTYYLNLKGLRLPWATKHLAKCLQIRLRELHGKGYLAEILSAAEWSDLIDDPLFVRAASLTDYLERETHDDFQQFLPLG
jgi:hypothetical protein